MMRSAKALAVPGTCRTTASTSVPMCSSVAKSGPAILMPTGVLMPVESMSMRVRMGIVQALLRPGICTASFIAVHQFIRRAAAVRDDFAVVILDVHGGPFVLPA